MTMIFGRKERLELLSQCIKKHIRGELSQRFLGGDMAEIVQAFYDGAKQSNMRSRPWALGNTMARLRGRSHAFHGKVETPNAFWTFYRDGQSPMQVNVETKDGQYQCSPCLGYHVSARALADIDRVIPQMVGYLDKLSEEKKEKYRVIFAIEQMTKDANIDSK